MRFGWSGTSTVRPSSSVTRREAKTGELLASTRTNNKTCVPTLRRSGIHTPHGHAVGKVFNDIERTGILRQSKNVLVFHAKRIGERNANDAGMGYNQHASASVRVNNRFQFRFDACLETLE